MNLSFLRSRGLLHPLLWLLPAVLSTLAACAGATSAPGGAVALVGTEWQLLSINGQPVMDRSRASLQFPESGRVAGNGSCNTFVGAVAIDNENIIFRQMASTKMACMGGASQQEIPWGPIMAASVIVTVPLVILVLIFQRKIVAGLTAGGVKG